MAKAKFDFKDLLLKKGEYAVLGAAGLGLVLLLVMGVSKLSAAKDPKTVAAGLTAKAKNIDTAVLAPAPDGLVPPLEPWATKKADKGVDAFPPVPATEFTLVTAPFDPVAKPDTKRENPKVLSIGEYQVDLVRGPMKAFDVVYDGENSAKIGVLVAKKKGDLDKEALKKAAAAINKLFYEVLIAPDFDVPSPSHAPRTHGSTGSDADFISSGAWEGSTNR